MLKLPAAKLKLIALVLGTFLFLVVSFFIGKVDSTSSTANRKIASVTLKDFKLNPNKKTVCTITINSDDERKKFKKYLNPKNFNFVELTDFAEKDQSSGGADTSVTYSNNDWFQSACDSGIKCDVLVISGHFGGTFFGASELSLSLNTLESQVCSNSCGGILNHPKEVFLMGCNTLAGKQTDRRTPAQYVAVLMQDGFSRQDAEMIAGFRYSPMGSSNGDRMLNIFRGVPNVYGFNSIAPSGKTADPFLGSYLKEKGANYSNWLDQIDARGVNNQSLLKKFSETSIVQSIGASSQNPAQKLSCELNTAGGDFISKLQNMRRALNSSDMLEKLPHIVSFLERNYLEIHKLSDQDYKIVEDLALNGKFVGNIQKLIEGDALSYSLQTQIKLVKLLMLLDVNSVHWLPTNNKIVSNVLLNPTPEKKDIICSDFYENSYENVLYRRRPPMLKVSADMFREGLLKARKNKNRYENFLQTFQCLQPWNPELLPLVLDAAEAEFPRVKKGDSTNFNYLFNAIKGFSLHDKRVLDRIYSWVNVSEDIKSDVRKLVVQRAGREGGYEALLRKITTDPNLFDQNVSSMELSNPAQVNLLMQMAGNNKDKIKQLTEWFSYNLVSNADDFPENVSDQIKIIKFLFASKEIEAIRVLPLEKLKPSAIAFYNEMVGGSSKEGLRAYLRGYHAGFTRVDNRDEFAHWKSMAIAIKKEYFRGYVEGAKDKGSLDWDRNDFFTAMFTEMGLYLEVLIKNPYVFDLLVQFRVSNINAQLTENLFVAYVNLVFSQTEDQEGYVTYNYEYSSFGEEQIVVGLADTMESIDLNPSALLMATKNSIAKYLNEGDPNDLEYPKRVGILMRPLIARKVVTPDAIAFYTESLKSPNRFIRARAGLGLLLQRLEDVSWKTKLGVRLLESLKKFGLNDVADVYAWGIRIFAIEDDPALKKPYGIWRAKYGDCRKCQADEE